MILSNVNIGTGPSAGDGDPLRTAFNTINENFERIESNVNALTNSVSSVAGRTGNVVLTTQDIIGINNYATVSYVNSQLANAGAANISSLQSNVAALQADVNTLYGNAGVQSATLATLTANAAAQAGSLTTLTSNAASQAGELTTLLSNAAVQAGEIASLLSNAGSQHEAISSLQSNAAVQAGLIAALQSNVNTYGNSNVASYLPTYSGNVGLDNLLFTDLSVQTTAYTGQSWRTLLESTLNIKPSWLSYYPDGLKTVLNTNYGFDGTGMWFYGDATNQHAYPIRTNVHFHETDVCEIITTIYFGNANNDHGFAIFNTTTTQPYWRESIDSTRIAFQLSVGTPKIYGQTTSAIGTSNLLTAGNDYTIRFVYNPNTNVTVYIHAGTSTSGTLLETLTLAEALPAGDYIIGFDADQDAAGFKSYYTNLTVKTLTNAVFNDVDVINNLSIGGTVVGNLVPQSNVTQSLGNVTHQWKELWVSGNTIHLGGAQLSVSGGVINTSLPIAGNVQTSNLIITGANISFSNGAYIEETEIVGNPGYYGLALNSSDDGVVGINALDTNSVIATSVIASNASVNINTSDSSNVLLTHTWTFNNTGDLTLPGNIVSGNGQVNFVANSSGDGNGYSTIELRPDVNQAGTDQYLIVDPTAPGHIHIRAGGEQDNSSADLIFGGENSHVRIPAGANTAPYIKSDGYEWQFGTDGILTLAAGGSIYAPVNDPIDIRVRDSGNVGYAIEQSVRDGTGTLQTLTSLDRQEFKIYTDFQDTNNVWTFAKSGQFSLAGNLRFADNTVQTTAWTGTVAYGNTIAIGYQTGNTSQGNNAVAIGSTAGQTSQGAKAIGIGEVAGRLNQGIESIGLGAGAGEQNQGAYAIAIGSTTAYLNQGVGAVAIGTSAGALYQGEHAIAIGTGAGNGLQGNNSIILNATGGTLDQTTDDTFTVKPIRAASAGNVLYYDPSSGEITYSTFSVTYGNTIALGYSAGVDQGEYSIAIGSEAGATTQGNLAVAVGRKAGSSIQGDGAVAVGESAGWVQQGEGAVAVGREAGLGDQSAYAVAIGYNAGADTQGAYSIAIGHGAGTAFQPANSIIINSSADSLNISTAGLYINPIRNTTGNVGVLQYNNVTKEVSYSSNVTLGNVTAGNVRANNNVHFGTGNARITSDDNTSILLTPDTAANGLAGVKIGGNGYLLASNGARNITLNYGSVNGAVGLQANVTVGTSASSILTVNGNVTANNISTIGSILSTGASGKIGYSAGGYVVQSGNTSGVTLNTVSGNIQLDTVNIAVNTSHTVALTNNKLDASDIILVQGQDSSALDLHIGAYYLTTNTAIIYLRNISGSSIGPIAPMLKFIIVKAPGS